MFTSIRIDDDASAKDAELAKRSASQLRDGGNSDFVRLTEKIPQHRRIVIDSDGKL
jgi:hypothetical protein